MTTDNIESLEERQARYERAVAYRRDSLTFKQIGELLGITRQRAKSIIKNGPPREIGRPRKETQ